METPLHLACKFGQVKAVRYLVSLGPKVRDSLLNMDGKRAIDIVCQKKCPLSGMCSRVVYTAWAHVLKASRDTRRVVADARTGTSALTTAMCLRVRCTWMTRPRRFIDC